MSPCSTLWISLIPVDDASVLPAISAPMNSAIHFTVTGLSNLIRYDFFKGKKALYCSEIITFDTIIHHDFHFERLQ